MTDRAPPAPTFSVVVAAYESAGRIETVAGSVLAQTRGDLELIVVDDGSTDGTAEVVEGLRAVDGRVRLIRQANAGTAAAFTAGAHANLDCDSDFSTYERTATVDAQLGVVGAASIYIEDDIE